MPTFVVTHRESKEIVVLVEASSREQAESCVAEAASAGDFFEANGVLWEYEDDTDADEADAGEKPDFRVNENEELERVRDGE